MFQPWTMTQNTHANLRTKYRSRPSTCNVDSQAKASLFDLRERQVSSYPWDGTIVPSEPDFAWSGQWSQPTAGKFSSADRLTRQYFISRQGKRMMIALWSSLTSEARHARRFANPEANTLPCFGTRL